MNDQTKLFFESHEKDFVKSLPCFRKTFIMNISKIISTESLQEFCRTIDGCSACELFNNKLCGGGVLYPPDDTLRQQTLRKVTQYLRKKKLEKLLS